MQEHVTTGDDSCCACQAAYAWLRTYVASRRRRVQSSTAAVTASGAAGGVTTLSEFPEFLLPFLVQVRWPLLQHATNNMAPDVLHQHRSVLSTAHSIIIAFTSHIAGGKAQGCMDVYTGVLLMLSLSKPSKCLPAPERC